MIARAICEAAFRDAARACDPAVRVAQALERAPIVGPIIGLAVGKAALAMARGAGPVARGLVVTNAQGGGALPAGWTAMVASHPTPDEASLAAGVAAMALVDSARAPETLLALISGGASSLVEVPESGVTLDELVRHTRTLSAQGASIHELNALRTTLSAIKGGKLAARSKVPVVTLVVSDVIGDDPRVVGSGPTVAPGARMDVVVSNGDESRVVASRPTVEPGAGVDVVASLGEDPRVVASRPTVQPGTRVEVIAPMALFGEEVVRALAARGSTARRGAEPIAGDVVAVADALVAELLGERGPYVAWGEPTVTLAAVPGIGGRAQQLALELARRLRGTEWSAFVAGSDGIDGASRAAGAYVDGTTWEAIVAAGISPGDALARNDAGTALDAIGAVFVTGPTGVNHADVVVIG